MLPCTVLIATSHNDLLVTSFDFALDSVCQLIVFVFYTGRSQFKLAEAYANTVTRQVMLSGEIGGTPPIETFLVDTKTCGDIMRGFRVSSAETPIVAAGR